MSTFLVVLAIDAYRDENGDVFLASIIAT